MARNDPLGCPFCGGFEVNICRTNPNACWVECANETCGAQTNSRRSRTDAIAVWNRRAHPGMGPVASIKEDDDRDRWTLAQKRAAR